jgi:hypothetical protein
MTWEGWLVDAVWCASFLGIAPLLRKDSQHPLWGLGLFFGLIAVLWQSVIGRARLNAGMINRLRCGERP